MGSTGRFPSEVSASRGGGGGFRNLRPESVMRVHLQPRVPLTRIRERAETAVCPFLCPFFHFGAENQEAANAGRSPRMSHARIHLLPLDTEGQRRGTATVGAARRGRC